MHFIWVSMYSTGKYQLGTLLLDLLLETGPPFYVVIRATRMSSRSQVKGSVFILSYFKTLIIGPAPEISSATSRSAIKHSTDWVNPAAV